MIDFYAKSTTENQKRIENLKWIKFENRNNIKNKNFPGIYIVAKTKNNLENKHVNIKDIYYVGMTNSKAGLIGRLEQFDSGIHLGYGHSGANRLFKEIKKKIPYNKWIDGEKLFIATFSIMCNVNKSQRTPIDLLTMGEITLLEFEILAMLKKELGKEPELNKK